MLGQGQWTPAPWINVVANPEFGFHVSESGSGYTWSRQQPGEQADAVVERSGERHAGRGVLRARSGQRSDLGADVSSDPRRSLALRHPARSGLQSLRAHVPRHRAGSAAVRAAGRPDQDLAPHAGESVQSQTSAFGHGLCGVGPGRHAQSLRTLRGHRDRSRDRCHVRAQRLER